MDTKEKILLASLELFSKDGYEAVSVSMIADALGITKGALYKHYTNKRDIFDSILRRMEENDRSGAERFSLPVGIFDEMPESYRNTAIEQLVGFTMAQFIYWTEDPFASRFRRMITLEQFRSPEMNALFQQYLGTGPLKYTEDLLREMPGFDRRYRSAAELALEFYGPVFTLINLYDGMDTKGRVSELLKKHFEHFVYGISGYRKPYASMDEYPRSRKYGTAAFMSRLSGPNPIKLTEELLENSALRQGSVVCDLGCGKGLTSVFLAKEYGLKVYAVDPLSDPEENRRFFTSQGLLSSHVLPLKTELKDAPVEKEFFDAVVNVGAFNYYGRDDAYLSDEILPYVKHGGYIYIAVPGMVKDCHDALPEELLLSWTPEQLAFMHDVEFWRGVISKTPGVEALCIEEMHSRDEVWRDWLTQDNPYAARDRRSMEAGAGKYLNFIKMILRKT